MVSDEDISASDNEMGFMRYILSKESKISKKIEKYNLERILFIYTAILLLLLFTRCFNNNFWCDEAYTIRLLNYDFITMIDEETRDMHPPLYHIIFYLSCKIFGSTPFVFHIVSYVPYLLAILLTITVLKKRFGTNFSLIMVTFLSLLFSSFYFVQEVRMYEWGMFFILCSFISAITLMEKNRTRDYILVTIFLVLSAYTHYYCLLAAGAFYLCLFMWAIKTKEKKTIIKIVLSAVAAILMYLPWVIHFVSIFFTVTAQGNNVHKFQFITRYIISLFENGAVIFFVIILIVLILYLIRKYNIVEFEPNLEKKIDRIISFFRLEDTDWKWISMGMVVIFITMIPPLVFSNIIQPIIEPRYMYPVSAIAWFIVSFCASKCEAKNFATVAVIAVTLLFAIPLCTYTIIDDCIIETEIKDTLSKTQPYVEEGDVICASESTPIWTVLVYYYPNTTVKYLSDGDHIPQLDRDYYWLCIMTPMNDAMKKELEDQNYSYETMVENGNLGTYDTWFYKLTKQSI